MSERVSGQVLTPSGWVRGHLWFDDRILGIEPDAGAPDERFVLPGFIDLHVHGGGGADVMDGAAAVRAMAAFHARHGTTSLLATTVTAPVEHIRAAARGIAAAMAPGPGARVLGLHLEGPFINPEALGAQPPFALGPDLALARELHAMAPIRVATMAPEIDPDGHLLTCLAGLGTRVQIGHTRCTCAQALQALHRGATGFTHLYNAMTGLHHRAAGAVGCALAYGKHAELILDFEHVEPAAALAALRAIPGLYLITDAVAAAGQPDGEYRLGEHRIFKKGPTVRLATGGLAGSVLTMDQALRNLLSLGVDLASASRRVSEIPAAYLGVDDRGVLRPGAFADLAVVDAAGALLAVVTEGRAVALVS